MTRVEEDEANVDRRPDGTAPPLECRPGFAIVGRSLGYDLRKGSSEKEEEEEMQKSSSTVDVERAGFGLSLMFPSFLLQRPTTFVFFLR